MKSPTTATIYIQLLDEGTIAYRPTYGEVIADNIFRVLPTENYDPDEETWEFPPDTVVRCERKMLSGGEEGLLAVVEYNVKDV